MKKSITLFCSLWLLWHGTQSSNGTTYAYVDAFKSRLRCERQISIAGSTLGPILFCLPLGLHPRDVRFFSQHDVFTHP